MEYKTEYVRPLSYYAQITYLSFHPMEKDEDYQIHSVKGQIKFHKPLFGLFKGSQRLLRRQLLKLAIKLYLLMR